ncbi:MAG: DNA helicase II, partial [Thermaurantiacus tibetensis]
VTRVTTMTGGASLWRAAVMGEDDPFAHLARSTGRGPGWSRAAAQPRHDRTIEGRVLASTVGRAPRADIAVGGRVFHQKFGPGTVTAKDGSRLEVAFDHAGTKMVMDDFVEPAGGAA